MYDRLEIFQMAHGLARHAAARQAAIATNVANADTPGYRARDITPFSETYQADQNGRALRTTRAGHSGAMTGSADAHRLIDRPGSSSPNGNTVSLENEIMIATEVRHQHDLALTVYQSSMNILRTALGRGR